MAKSVTVMALALLAAAVACGPSGSVSPRVQTGDAGDARAVADSPRLADAPSTPDAGPGPIGPVDATAEDVAADLGPTSDAPANPTPDAPANVDVRLPPDLPPDLPAPPDLAPDLPPDVVRPGPWVTVNHAPAQALTNLTTAGPLDWVHFGQGGAMRVNRKTGAPMRITMMPVGASALFGYDDRPVRFSWSDGTPTAQLASTNEGISNGDETGRGFELRVQGDVARPRQLKVYWGVWGGRARLVVRLSDDSVPAYMDTTLVAGNPGADRITTIDFRPSQASQTLIVRWTIETISLQYGNVTLQAAALSE